MIIKKYRL